MSFNKHLGDYFWHNAEQYLEGAVLEATLVLQENKKKFKKNLKRCRDGVPKSKETRCRDSINATYTAPSLHLFQMSTAKMA